MEWLDTILNALGGGLSGVVIIGLAWKVHEQSKRIDTLTDRQHAESVQTQTTLVMFRDILTRLEQKL
ncbi:hypothetical protein JANAI62_03640 [Jannaschia pagri]|uniref:Uncharacterized protein n=1 Tax=Jannaschia pagri TaxID=2829797 RepID=A0ABQ4NH41_9RHOB|nr:MULTISPECIES: hypothetical protein [unclassified Jannaschia]GIT90153.1 hypothetical protein JANAI61_06110 [Jannaschia sp. AI_61]GIT93741.1 hypothetical protein JANAI62_03640 [Jannaschia sp. AI_62]